MDASGIDIAPVRNDFSPASIFFLAWMIVGSFVALNLFVGAIVDNFTRIKQENEGSATMTPEQQQWVQAMKTAQDGGPSKGPREPTFPPRLAAFKLITSLPFEFTVIGAISCNMLWMATDHHGIEENPLEYQIYANGLLAFNYFYYCEFIIKLFAMGSYYFQDSWCRFDFTLVCLAAVDQFAAEYAADLMPVPPTMLRVMRIARVLRIVRLIKNFKGLRDLAMTLVLSFPALTNIGALLGIVVFIYAVLGMNLFTFVKQGENINDVRNFETFGNACLLLFQCITGDGWSAMMDDAMITEEYGCDPSPEDGSPSNCGSPLALPYFITFVVIATFVFLNLVVAVILENFTAIGSTDPNLVSAGDISDFKDEWSVFDPDANGVIDSKDLPALVLNVKEPLGLKGSRLLLGPGGPPRNRAMRFCLGLSKGENGLRQTHGGLKFKDVLDALIEENYRKKAQSAFISTEMPAVLTPRTRENSAMYATEILSSCLQTKREESGTPTGARLFTTKSFERRRTVKQMEEEYLASKAKAASPPTLPSSPEYSTPSPPKRSAAFAPPASSSISKSGKPSSIELPAPTQMPPPKR
uniref:Calcium-channel protein CCH1 n=1 Tax=Haptolina brevifila TaxID=156173 RepID=A0A7S2NBM4_9EUKA